MKAKFGFGKGTYRDIVGWLLVMCVFGAVLALGKEFNTFANILNFLSGLLALIFILDTTHKLLSVRGDLYILILALSGLFSPTLLIWNPLGFPLIGVSLSHFLLLLVAVISFIRAWPPVVE